MRTITCIRKENEMHNAVRDNTLTAEQRIERAFVEITSKDRYLFLASILMHGKLTGIDFLL